MSSSVRASPFRETEWDRRFNNLMDDLENSAAANTTTSQSKANFGSSHGLAAPDNVLRDLNSALNASSNYIENHRTETGPGNTTEYHEYKTYSTSHGGKSPSDFDLQEKVQHMMPSSGYMTSSKEGYSPLSSANMVSSLQHQQQQSNNTSQKTAISSSQVQNSVFNTSSQVQNSVFNTSSKMTSESLQDRPGSRLKQNIEELDTLLYDLNNAQKMSDTGGDYTASSITPGQISSDDYSFSEGGPLQDKTRLQSNGSSSAFNEYSASSDTKLSSPSPKNRFPSSTGGVAVLSSPASVRKAAGHHVYQTTTTTTTKTVREQSPFDYARPSSTTPLQLDSRSHAKNLEYNKTASQSDYSRSTNQYDGSAHSDYGRTTPIPVVHEYNTSSGMEGHNATQSQEYNTSRSQQEFNSRTTANTSSSRSHQDYGRSTTTTGNVPSGFVTSAGRDTPDYNKDGTEPKGAAYYSKYHSSHTHKSQQQNNQSTTQSFPTSGRTTPSFPNTGSASQQQQPPKRVDELMTELSEFDPSIQPTNFVEPRPVNKMTHTTYKHREDDTNYLLKKESHLDGGSSSAAGLDGQEPMPNIAGPAVYYPPGEMFSSETAHDSASAPLNPSSDVSSSKHRSKSHGKSKKDKGKSSDSDGKQGAAVVPLCLPLCCAVPCVIM